MLNTYIAKQLNRWMDATVEHVKIDALYRIASHGDVLPLERLVELSVNPSLTEDEQQIILSWAKAQVD
jgi:hypothetical protein